MADLHHIIQIAMTWDIDHLHCFYIFGEDCGLKYSEGIDFNHSARQSCLSGGNYFTEQAYILQYGESFALNRALLQSI